MRLTQLIGESAKKNCGRRLIAIFFVILFSILTVTNAYATIIVYTLEFQKNQQEPKKLIIVGYDADTHNIGFITVLSAESMLLPIPSKSRPVYSYDNKKIPPWQVSVRPVEIEGLKKLVISYSHKSLDEKLLPQNIVLEVSPNNDEDLLVRVVQLGTDVLLIGNVINGLDGINYYQQMLLNRGIAMTRNPEVINRRMPIEEITVDTTRKGSNDYALCSRVKNALIEKQLIEGEKVTMHSAKKGGESGRRYVFKVTSDSLAMVSPEEYESFFSEVAEWLSISLGVFNGWVWYPSKIGRQGCDAIFVHDDPSTNGSVVLISDTKSAIEGNLYQSIDPFIHSYFGKGLKKKIENLMKNEKGIAFLLKKILFLERPVRILRQIHGVVGKRTQQFYREALSEGDRNIFVNAVREGDIDVETYVPKLLPFWEEIENSSYTDYTEPSQQGDQTTENEFSSQETKTSETYQTLEPDEGSSVPAISPNVLSEQVLDNITPRAIDSGVESMVGFEVRFRGLDEEELDLLRKIKDIKIDESRPTSPIIRSQIPFGSILNFLSSSSSRN